jgi:hypothetical protein
LSGEVGVLGFGQASLELGEDLGGVAVDQRCHIQPKDRENAALDQAVLDRQTDVLAVAHFPPFHALLIHQSDEVFTHAIAAVSALLFMDIKQISMRAVSLQ